ncbi:MAG: FAD-dependent oxidoreductase [Ardenticatenales bacterium]|nr:FAD-dependent oxidoreductase [Ardenticatenales bacterium]
MQQVLVLGGGIAGLMAAMHLAERGVTPLLLEADPQWIGGRLKGGASVEIEHQGRRWSFPGEHGVHGIWSPYLNFKAALARHGILPELVVALEESWIMGRGKKIQRADIGSAIRYSMVPAPFHYLHLFTRIRFLNMITLRDFAALPRIAGSLFSAMSIDPLAERKALSGMTLADFTEGWSPNVRSLFAGLARNALAAHPEEIPAAGFIAFLRFYTLLRRDAWNFSYLPNSGGTSVSEPLAQVVQNLGCEIRMGCRATQVEHTAAGWEVSYETEQGEAQRVAAPLLLLALDAPSAKALLCSSVTTAEIAETLYFPTGVPTAIIRLWFDQQPRAGAEAGIYSGDFVVDNFFWLHRLQSAYKEWSRATGGSAIEMHIYGPPELLAQPDALLLARVITDTYRAFPELRGHLMHQVLLRNAPTHTLFSVGDPHLGIETPWPGLFACGDWVYHPAPALYLERATVTGIAAANALLSVLGLEPWPLLPHPEPEWFAGKVAHGWWRVRQALLRRSRRAE